MREIASSPEAIEYLRGCVHGENGPKAAIAAWRLISERGYGRVPQPVEVRSALSDLDLNLLPDKAISRLAAGEDVVLVLLEVVLEGGDSPPAQHVRGFLPALLAPEDEGAE